MNCERIDQTPLFFQEICTDVTNQDADQKTIKAAEWVAQRELTAREKAVITLRALLTVDGINQVLVDIRYFGSYIQERQRRIDAFSLERLGRQVTMEYREDESVMFLDYIGSANTSEE